MAEREIRSRFSVNAGDTFSLDVQLTDESFFLKAFNGAAGWFQVRQPGGRTIRCSIRGEGSFRVPVENGMARIQFRAALPSDIAILADVKRVRRRS